MASAASATSTTVHSCEWIAELARKVCVPASVGKSGNQRCGHRVAHRLQRGTESGAELGGQALVPIPQQFIKTKSKKSMNPQKLLVCAVAVVLTLLSSISSLAESKVVTLVGEAGCAKCLFNVGEGCQKSVRVEAKGKQVVYVLGKNAVSDALGGKLCKLTQKVTATGVVNQVDGRLMLTASALDLKK